ncbi:Oxoglutarate/iron-dependent oxygenase [Metarhizium album ARSEF 1941]|uniref:Oxoglutarate/iron-dependent oxygenase n=1 Tax=Metarhizium album (strain ARSEF 1941) TaxID=1081103 RepID=A0A0B2WW01_METAS|nr:Oxoglutarate/iron-dependent oxygenase [Metarhizium album ARSEF 1941]KHN97090.1 Oxoglutarate/iron-dependent oxygenase [Metarhizium album ARSEF 1941]
MAAFTSIPVIDLSLAQSPATKPRLVIDLRNALVRVGFLYLENHGIPQRVSNDAIRESAAFFRLPLEKKLEIETVHSRHFLGYNRMDAERTAAKVDHNESIATPQIGADLPAPGAHEPVYMNLQGPSQWPDASVLPNFKAAITTYRRAVQALADRFTPLIAEALEIPAPSLTRLFADNPFSRLKITNYPPPAAAAGHHVQGVGPHKDGVFMTYLLQGGAHNALQVQNKSGAWIPVPPVPGTLVVNIGRLLEIISGGVCTATTHRVVSSPGSYAGADGEALGPRLSLPFFQHVNLRLMPGDMRLDIPPHIAALVAGEDVTSDSDTFFAGLFDGAVGDSVFVSLLTSFQDAAARWYPDLLPLALEKQEEARRR